MRFGRWRIEWNWRTLGFGLIRIDAEDPTFPGFITQGHGWAIDLFPPRWFSAPVVTDERWKRR